MANSQLADKSAVSLAWPGAPLVHRRSLALAIPALDAFLDGGVPRGGLTEIVGGVSSGRTTFAHALAQAAVRAGEYVVWIDVGNAFDPSPLYERTLWVFPGDRAAALRAVEHVLEAGGFGVLILDLDFSPNEPFEVPSSRWLRVSRDAARRDATVLVLSATPVTGAYSMLSLELGSQRRFFSGVGGPCPVFEGFAGTLRVRRRRYGPIRANDFDFLAMWGER